MPLWIADLLYPRDWKVAEGFGMAWGMGVTLPCTALSAVSLVVQGFRVIAYFLNGPRPISK